MGAHEIRMRSGGVSRQRVYQIASRPDFPEPAADLVQGKVWRAEDVEAWIVAKRVVVNNHGQAPLLPVPVGIG